MATSQSSFRRILLSHILLLSVPVLLMGVFVTYKKARSTLLETARQNLTVSAVREGERIRASVEALSANSAIASQAAVWQSGPAASQKFLNQLAKVSPTKIQCVQLVDLKTKKLRASTCGQNSLLDAPINSWLQNLQVKSDRPPVYLSTPKTVKSEGMSQLPLILTTPIYEGATIRYALIVSAMLIQQMPIERGSPADYPAIIAQDGTILAHPLPERVGDNIDRNIEANLLKGMVSNAIAGKQDSLHLFFLEKDGVELLAGYTAIPSPLSSQPNQKWVVLAVNRLDTALSGLREIRQVLFILTLGLLAASVLTTLYISRDLARPLEKLRDYALDEQKLHSDYRIPENFEIRELNQLAKALNGMVRRLKDWAEELETAWQEAQTASQLKNEFLANTSHELRTPLNGIIGCIRLVRDGCCDDREEELDFLQRADDAAIHLLGIINDVLDIAKIEAGKLSVVLEPIDLRKLLKEVIDLQSIPIYQKGLQFQTPELKDAIAIHADPAKLKQVLLNIVGNAVKFTDSGSIIITTQIKTVSSDSDSGHSSSQVIVAVQDSGIGIDPVQQPKLFRPFVMVDGTTTRQYGGTGLGLAISRNLIELMGGAIALSSEGIGKGTTVEITLPTIELARLSSQNIQPNPTIKTVAVDK